MEEPIGICTDCNNVLLECICPNLDQKLLKLGQSGQFTFRKCRTCDKHHSRCKCVVPEWVSSYDGKEMVMEGEKWVIKNIADQQ